MRVENGEWRIKDGKIGNGVGSNNSHFSSLNSQLQNRGTILLVEDDVNLNKINRMALTSEGYTVHTALTLAEARKILNSPLSILNLILLDVKLPDGIGFDFCKEIRGKPGFAAVPVLFLTSVNDNAGEMEGLRSGGNDYLRKPYDIDLLRMRVANLLRLQENTAQQVITEQKIITKGALSIDTVARRAYVDSVDLNLHTKQFALLLTLAQHESEILSTPYLYETVWGQPMNRDSQALRRVVSEVRSKISGCGYSITSERGEGYRFEQGE